MRPLQHSFLFCCPLRTGGVIVAVAHMLTAGILLFINGEYLDDFDAQFLQARESGCVEGSAAEYNLEKMLLLIDLVIQSLGLAFAVILLLGALKGKAKLVLAWAVYAQLALGLYASRTVGLYLSNGQSTLAHSHSTLALVTVLTLYCAAAMLKLYQELRDLQVARNGGGRGSASSLHPHLHHHPPVPSTAAHHPPPPSPSPYATAALEPPSPCFERI